MVRTPDFSLIGFADHPEACAFLSGIADLLGCLRLAAEPWTVPDVQKQLVVDLEGLREAVTVTAQVQLLSLHAGNGCFWTKQGESIRIDALRPAASSAVIVDCCHGEVALNDLQVSSDVVVIGASADRQNHELYPHDSLATFLPVVSEMAWSWSGYGEAGLTPERVWKAAERAAVAVLALRNLPEGESDRRPTLIAKHQGSVIGDIKFEPTSFNPPT